MARFYTDEHGFLRWESESGIVDKKVIYIAQWMQTSAGGYVFDGKYKFLNLCFPEFMESGEEFRFPGEYNYLNN